MISYICITCPICVTMSYLCLSFHLFSVSVSMNALMLLLELDEWRRNYMYFLDTKRLQIMSAILLLAILF